MDSRYKKYITSCDRHDLYNFKDYINTLYNAGFISRKYYDYLRKLINKRFDEIKNIPSLLKQGKAYREIVEALEKNYSFLRNDVTRSNKIIYLKSIINDLKQKYLK